MYCICGINIASIFKLRMPSVLTQSTFPWQVSPWQCGQPCVLDRRLLSTAHTKVLCFTYPSVQGDVGSLSIHCDAQHGVIFGAHTVLSKHIPKAKSHECNVWPNSKQVFLLTLGSLCQVSTTFQQQLFNSLQCN